MSTVMLVNTNVAKIPLRDKSVHMVATSPPYWGLRDYGLPPTIWGGDENCDHEWEDGTRKGMTGGATEKQVTNKGSFHTEHRFSLCKKCGAWLGCLGLEPTPEMYVEHIVLVARELYRVLRDDGTFWLNLGDSYAGSGGPGSQYDSKATHGYKGEFKKYDNPNRKVDGLKPKDLVGIPWAVAFALRNDGWYLRSDCIWSKNNPMPESVTDRPTKSHEYVFLLTKSERYFYDADAIREESKPESIERYSRGSNYDGSKPYAMKHGPRGSSYSFARNVNESPPPNQRSQHREDREDVEYSGSRNRRTVWSISTAPYAGAHFATWPPALVEPMIKAGTSEAGCCSICGAPWERVTDHEPRPANEDRIKKLMAKGVRSRQSANLYTEHKPNTYNTLGFRPTCPCYPRAMEWEEYIKPEDPKNPTPEEQAENERIRNLRQELMILFSNYSTIPATVLDPFAGSGTTLLVARKLNRNAIGLDLSYSYLHEQARKRLELDQLEEWENGIEVTDNNLSDLPMFGMFS